VKVTVTDEIRRRARWLVEQFERGIIDDSSVPDDDEIAALTREAREAAERRRAAARSRAAPRHTAIVTDEAESAG
jgi:hypothetical protein